MKYILKPIQLEKKSYNYVSNFSLPVTCDVDYTAIIDFKSAIAEFEKRMSTTSYFGVKRTQLENASLVFKKAEGYKTSRLVSVTQKGGFLLVRVGFNDFSELLKFKEFSRSYTEATC